MGATTLWAQELGGAGTVQGTVKDPTAGVMQSVEVKIANPVSGFVLDGFNCGGAFATRDTALTDANCTTTNYGATRLRIPAEGTADDALIRRASRHGICSTWAWASTTCSTARPRRCVSASPS